MRNKELSVDDLHAILYWYSKAFRDNVKESEEYKNTLIKIQALAIYAQEEEEHTSSCFRRRMR